MSKDLGRNGSTEMVHLVEIRKIDQTTAKTIKYYLIILHFKCPQVFKSILFQILNSPFPNFFPVKNPSCVRDFTELTASSSRSYSAPRREASSPTISPYKIVKK